MLNLGQQQFSTLAQKSANAENSKFEKIMFEVVRNYCKNFAAEIELLQHLLPFITRGQISARLMYQQQTTKIPTLKVLGLEYIPQPL